MAWTTPTDRTTGFLVTASVYDAEIIDNLKYLHGDGGVSIDVSAGGQMFIAAEVTTGPGVGGFTGAQAVGTLLNGGTSATVRTFVSAAGNVAYTVGVTTDTSPNGRFYWDGTGSLNWGPGGAAATDSTFRRLANGVLGDTGTSLSTGPTSQAATGTQVSGVLIDGGLGRISAFYTSTGVNILQSAVTTDTQYRFQLNLAGTMSWGPGGSTSWDTQMARLAPNILGINAKTVESFLSTTAGAGTWTPSLANGLVQRYVMNATGTLTIASPGTPPTNYSGFLVLIIHNSSGGTITLSWNAIFNNSAAAPANGLGIMTVWCYNNGTGKWASIQNITE